MKMAPEILRFESPWKSPPPPPLFGVLLLGLRSSESPGACDAQPFAICGFAMDQWVLPRFDNGKGFGSLKIQQGRHRTPILCDVHAFF